LTRRAGPRPLRLTTFANDEGYDELVMARAIPFRTVCEHHLLPFSGVAHVGYLPGERIVGLSKLARLVEHFAARPQIQERRPARSGRLIEAGGLPRFDTSLRRRPLFTFLWQERRVRARR
jgi:GTP cyclohydrolase IA